ncbi:MAG: hypothetical protein ACE5HV_07160 [Acidobacteriota bacterium]
MHGSKDVNHRLALGCILLLAVFSPPAPATAAQDAQVLLARVKELFAAMPSKRIVVPAPGSRSVVLAADGAADFFLYLEKGSIRGKAIDTFYQQYESGDLEGAYDTFVKNNIVTLRVSDFGWNGLGVPMIVKSGREVRDRHFRGVNGIFQQAEVTPEDARNYLELLRTVLIPALEKMVSSQGRSRYPARVEKSQAGPRLVRCPGVGIPRLQLGDGRHGQRWAPF